MGRKQLRGSLRATALCARLWLRSAARPWSSTRDRRSDTHRLSALSTTRGDTLGTAWEGGGRPHLRLCGWLLEASTSTQSVVLLAPSGFLATVRIVGRAEDNKWQEKRKRRRRRNATLSHSSQRSRSARTTCGASGRCVAGCAVGCAVGCARQHGRGREAHGSPTGSRSVGGGPPSRAAAPLLRRPRCPRRPPSPPSQR